MDLTPNLIALKQQSSDLSLAERADLSCLLAKELEKAGEYEAACEALREFWLKGDQVLKVDGLDKRAGAEVLLRAGSLAGWLGNTDQTLGGQERAKNLITKSIEIFEELGETQKV